MPLLWNTFNTLSKVVPRTSLFVHLRMSASSASMLRLHRLLHLYVCSARMSTPSVAYSVLIITVLLPPSQLTLPPKASATARIGIHVLLSFRIAAVSSSLVCPLTLICLFPISNMITVSSFDMVTCLTVLSQPTSAPSCSATNHLHFSHGCLCDEY